MKTIYVVMQAGCVYYEEPDEMDRAFSTEDRAWRYIRSKDYPHMYHVKELEWGG